jgi:SAM-dependent methyltransferase
MMTRNNMTLPAATATRPHDDLSFEELVQRYNFRQTTDENHTFARLVYKQCLRAPAPVRALDIGCGHGIQRDKADHRMIRDVVGEMWGVEPDTRVIPVEGDFTRFQHALFEEADLPADYFDVAYAYTVMEHIADPRRFLQALARCLKPGGVFLFGTPNARHYFGIAARWTHWLAIDEIVLRALRRPGGYDYHFPLQYKFNDVKTIRRYAQEAGFEPPEFAFLEAEGPISYMPGPLRPIFFLLAWKRRVLKIPEHLMFIVGRLTKPIAARNA